MRQLFTALLIGIVETVIITVAFPTLRITFPIFALAFSVTAGWYGRGLRVGLARLLVFGDFLSISTATNSRQGLEEGYFIKTVVRREAKLFTTAIGWHHARMARLRRLLLLAVDFDVE